MAREKWQLILTKASKQGKLFTKSECDEWLKPYYYGGRSSGYASQMLARMVKDGCIKRIKKGIYQVMRLPKPMSGGITSARVLVDATQISLF